MDFEEWLERATRVALDNSHNIEWMRGEAAHKAELRDTYYHNGSAAAERLLAEMVAAGYVTGG